MESNPRKILCSNLRSDAYPHEWPQTPPPPHLKGKVMQSIYVSRGHRRCAKEQRREPNPAAVKLPSGSAPPA